MELILSVIAVVGVLGAAGISAWTQVYLHKNVGRSNGLGTVTEMLELVIEKQGDHGSRILKLEDKVFVRGK